MADDPSTPINEVEGVEGGRKYDFVKPSKQVNSPLKMRVWEESQAYQDYLGFIVSIGENIVGRKITEKINISEQCARVISVIDSLKNLADQTPPTEMQSRYGNPAYRDWFDKMESSVPTLLKDILPEELDGAILEISPYLIHGFGDRTRIDYGTGHEMTFVMFVCSLFKIGFLNEQDKTAVGLKLFKAYFDLARLVQSKYRMEPAGSMGVWNLDDYQFVAFILGAAQLIKGGCVKPKSIAEPEMADMLANDYHFFTCLAYINQVKSGPFHEHSNQLWNISAVQLWSKVFTGLIKMYRAEVLCKFPVIQHSLFGSIFTLEKASTMFVLPGAEDQGRRVPGVDAKVPGVPGISGRISGEHLDLGTMPGRFPTPTPGVMPGTFPTPGPGVMTGRLPTP
jgi:serine/threonine-protein phosphatase 2A activator